MIRSTFIIDAKGKISKVFENVRAKENNEKVLAALGDLGAA